MVIRVLETLSSSDIICLPAFRGSSGLDLLFYPQSILKCEKISKEKRKEFSKFLAYKPCPLKDRKIESFLMNLKSYHRSVYEEICGVSFKGLFGKTVKISYSKNFTYLSHILKLSNAIYEGILTFKGQVPYHDSAYWKKGILVNRSICNSYPLLRLVLHYIQVIPKGLSENDLIKSIKISLTGKFSLIANQELPKDYEKLSFKILPNTFEQILCNKLSREEKIQLFFSLLQCKGLCQSVPETFLKEGLLKHKKSLCREEKDLTPFDQTMFNRMKEYSSNKFGEIVKDLYNPFKTKLACSSACLESSRQKGGTLSHLIRKQQLKVSLRSYDCSPLQRVEPLVIGLFGPPGLGKTKTIKSLVNYFNTHLFKEIEEEDLVYHRSCNVEFWDHYNDQPIVILDDFGQNLENRADLIEFEQLISCNPYYLPMANLEEKGKLFNSPIVIVTSNLCFGSSLNLEGSSNPILDIYSLWRRFVVPISLMSLNKELHYSLLELNNSDNEIDINKTTYHSYSHPSSYNCNNNFTLSGKIDLFQALNKKPLKVTIKKREKKLFQVIPNLKELYDNRLRYHKDQILNTWDQEISSLNLKIDKTSGETEYNVTCHEVTSMNQGIHIGLTFPKFPPNDEPIVQGVPLAEPLKVRVITKGQANLRVLKPLQMALWQSLTFYPEFNLTHGCKRVDGCANGESYKSSYELIEKEIQRISSFDGTYVSGDYDAATDNLPIWVSQALLEGILEHIDHEPTKAWARYEVSPHFVTYPLNYGIEPFTQNSGQLMGSLLSFPLLCMANDFLCSVLADFSPGSYLINGDDIVGKESLENINKWKNNASKIGLSLSLGKNFVDDQFCTVNSQLFFNQKRLNTGKVELIYRSDRPVGQCWQEFQKYYGINDIFFQQFIRNNYYRLKDTPSSLWIPVSHGGLGNVFVHSKEVDQQLGKKVYFCHLFRRIFKDRSQILKQLTNKKVSILSIPCFIDESYETEYNKRNQINSHIISVLDSLQIPEGEAKHLTDITRYDLRVWEKKVLIHYPDIIKIIQDEQIFVHHLPPLTHFRNIEKFVSSLVRDDLQIYHNKYFFSELKNYIKNPLTHTNQLFYIRNIFEYENPKIIEIEPEPVVPQLVDLSKFQLGKIQSSRYEQSDFLKGVVWEDDPQLFKFDFLKEFNNEESIFKLKKFINLRSHRELSNSQLAYDKLYKSNIKLSLIESANYSEKQFKDIETEMFLPISPFAGDELIEE